MKIAIFGAGGFVGREFTRQCSATATVLALTRQELDITDHSAVQSFICTAKPQLVINCAVLGIDACERDPSSAWAINVRGPENVAKAVASIDADMVQLSSNFVFSGNRSNGSFYTADDAPQPINVYGETKLAGEHAVRAAVRRSFIVRTSWVFGPGKSNFFSTVPRSLSAAKRVRAVTDVWASATYVKDLVSRIIEIVSDGRYATYHVVNDGLCSYYEFALEVACLLEVSDRALVEPVTLREFEFDARRPGYTPMRCVGSGAIGLAPLRDWRLALAEYVRELN